MSDSSATGAAEITPARAEINMPAGVAGPDPVSFDVAAFVVRRGSSILLVDALMRPEHAELLEAALTQAGVGFADINQVVLTHHHPDHTGGLADLVRRAPQAQILAGRGDVEAIKASTGVALDPLVTGDEVLGLEVIETPGHTPGHLCLFDAGTSTMLLGDLVGNVGGLQRPPAMFTEDPDLYEVTLRAVAERDFAIGLPSHGGPVPRDAAAALRELAAQR